MAAEITIPTLFLPLKEVAHQLVEIKSEMIETDFQDVELKHYRSSKNAELYMWLDSKSNIIKQYLCLYDLITEWNLIEGVQTGEKSYSGEIEYDKKPSEHTIQQACELVAEADNLDVNLQKQILYNLKNNIRIYNLDPVAFLTKFGNNSSVSRKGLFPKFVQSLKDAVSYLLKSK